MCGSHAADLATVWRLQWSLVSCQLTSACDWWTGGHVITTPASDWSAVAPGTLANVTCRLQWTETTVNLHTRPFSVSWCHISNTLGNYLVLAEKAVDGLETWFLFSVLL